MSVTLEVVATGDAPPLAESRKVFGVAGGTIGRARHSDWVLPHNKVSSRHARVTYEHSVFYIEDTSTNGIYLNSPDNRLEKGRLHPLHAGDRLYIEPYEIVVSISSDLQETRLRPMAAPPPPAAPSRHDPDPFAGVPLLGTPDIGPSPALPGPLTPLPVAEDEVDPLKLLGGGGSGSAPDARPVSTARDLDEGSLLGGHYQPPPLRVPPPVAPATPLASPPQASSPPANFIPENYDPLAPETRSFPQADVPLRAEPPPMPDFAFDPVPASPVPPSQVETRPDEEWLPSAVAGLPLMDASPAPPAVPAPPPYEARPTPPPRRPTPPPAAPVSSPPAVAATADLAGVLAAAGLPNVPVTSELTQKFGQILRVVVHGLMDVLRSRHQVKDEFRMKMTVVRPVDNNPLKLSANVDDALHNLLVKRNPAYLGPVESFQDAFDDLRRHQLAMLAGMRVAFDHVLAEFDADRLQADFERQVRKSSVFPIGSKLRYWDLYRDRQQELARDPEGTFRRLFGDAFTQAYEEQMKRLKDEQGRG